MNISELFERHTCNIKEKKLLLAKLYEIRFKRLIDEYNELFTKIIKL